MQVNKVTKITPLKGKPKVRIEIDVDDTNSILLTNGKSISPSSLVSGMNVALIGVVNNVNPSKSTTEHRRKQKHV